MSDNLNQTNGEIYHYELQNGTWTLLQTLSGNATGFGSIGRWDADNELLRIAIADVNGTYSQNTNGDNDYLYIMKFNSSNNQYEFSYGRKASNRSDTPNGGGKLKISSDGDNILYSNKSDKDGDGSVDDTFSRVLLRNGGSGCTTTSSNDTFQCASSFWAGGLNTVQVRGDYLSQSHYNPTSNLLGPDIDWNMLNSYQLQGNHGSLSSDGSRVIISQDQKYFYVFDKGKDYRAVSYSWSEDDVDFNYTLRANGIGFKEQGYSGTQTDLSCGSNHALSPDGSTLIIPKPGDGTFSCLNYTILRYPN